MKKTTPKAHNFALHEVSVYMPILSRRGLEKSKTRGGSMGKWALKKVSIFDIAVDQRQRLHLRWSCYRSDARMRAPVNEGLNSCAPHASESSHSVRVKLMRPWKD